MGYMIPVTTSGCLGNGKQEHGLKLQAQEMMQPIFSKYTSNRHFILSYNMLLQAQRDGFHIIEYYTL